MTDDAAERLRATVAPKVLEKLRLADAQYVSRKFAVEVDQDHLALIADRLAVRMETTVLADHLVADHYESHRWVNVPASWWQHFKDTYADSWWLRWLVRRRPPIFDAQHVSMCVSFDRWATYPYARIKEDHRLGAVVYREEVTES